MVEAVDAARGDVPREVWLRRAVEQALAREEAQRTIVAAVEASQQSVAHTEATLRKVGVDPASIGPPEPPALPRIRSSAQAKSASKPVPKGGKS